MSDRPILRDQILRAFLLSDRRAVMEATMHRLSVEALRRSTPQDVMRRELSAMREAGLVRTPLGSVPFSQEWELTDAGLDAAAEAFPEEGALVERRRARYHEGSRIIPACPTRPR
jgi:hypothetical protein